MSVPDQSLKGLVNNPGENNCFLNATIQVLWHLPVFRNSLSNLYGHYCLSGQCVFCALKTLFIRFEKVNKSAIPPDVLRRAMADAFHSQDRFQLGRMDDAAECYEHLLSRLHFHLAPDATEDACSQAHCITHAKCSMSVFEQSCCGCGEQSELLGFSQVVHYVSAAAVTTAIVDNKSTRLSFGRYVRNAVEDCGKQPCTSHCGGMSSTRKYLMNSPSIVCLGVIWNSETTPVDEIMMFVNAIEPTITLDHMFSKVTDSSAAGKQMQLVGMVMYYGQHYSSLFFSQSLRKWTYFDDSHVRVLDSNLATVKDLCQRAHYQPLLLIYADASATPVDFDKAPESVIHMSREQQRKTLHNQPATGDRSASLRRSLSSMSSPTRGAMSSEVTTAVLQKEKVVSQPDSIQYSAPETWQATEQRQQRTPPASISEAKVEPSAPLAEVSQAQVASASPPRPRQANCAVGEEERREIQAYLAHLKSEKPPSPPSQGQQADLINFNPPVPQFAAKAYCYGGASAAVAPAVAPHQDSSSPKPPHLAPYPFLAAMPRAPLQYSQTATPWQQQQQHQQQQQVHQHQHQHQQQQQQQQQQQSQQQQSQQRYPRAQPVQQYGGPALSSHAEQTPGSSAAPGERSSAHQSAHQHQQRYAHQPPVPSASTQQRAPSPARRHASTQHEPSHTAHRQQGQSAAVLRTSSDEATGRRGASPSEAHAGFSSSSPVAGRRQPLQADAPSREPTRHVGARNDGRLPSRSPSPRRKPGQSSQAKPGQSSRARPGHATSVPQRVDHLCMEADRLMVESAERDSEGRLADAVECLRLASCKIESASAAAEHDSRLLQDVKRQASLITRCHESLERRLRSRPAAAASSALQQAGNGGGAGHGRHGLTPQQPPSNSTASGHDAPRATSPNDAMLTQFLSRLGDTSSFNTEPSNYGALHPANRPNGQGHR